MSKLLQLLIVEVSEEDTELIVLELKSGGFEVTHERVNNAHAMALALDQKSWDLIISDYAMPQFNGLDALKLVQGKGLDLPFIIVSGEMGDELPVEALKAGVHDYILKDNLTHLVPAVERELNEAQIRLSYRESQETLRESEARYRGLFDHVPIGLYRTTPTGEFLDANQALVDLLAYPNKGTLLSTNVMEVYVDSQDRQRELDVLARDRVVTGSEFQLKRFDGISIWVEITSRAILSADRSILYYEGSVQDITERKKTAQSLLESEERFRRLSQASFEGISITHQGKFIDVNEQFTRMLGYERSEIIGRPVLDLVAPESRELVTQHMESGYERPYELFAVKKDGATFPVEVHGKSISYAGGTARVTAIKDITERKQAQADLQYYRSFENLVTSISTRFISVHSDQVDAEIQHALQDIGEFAGVDRSYIWWLSDDLTAATRTYEWSVAGLQPIEKVLKHLSPEKFPWMAQSVLAGEATHISSVADLPPEARAEKELFQSWGVKSVISVPLISQGNLIGLLGFQCHIKEMEWSPEIATILRIVGDIFANALERKRSDDALRLSEIRFRSLVEQTSDAVFCYEYHPPIPTNLPIDKQVALFYQGTLVECNDVCARSYGASRAEEVIGKPLIELFGTTQDSLDNFFRTFILNDYRVAELESTEVLTDGTKRYFSNNGYGVFVKGKLVRVWGTFQDITERKRAEQEIQNNLSRLEAIREIELSILAAQSPGDTAITALERIQELLPYNFGGVVLYDFDANQVEFLATYTTGEDIDPLTTRSYTIDEFTPYIETLRTGQIYIMPDLAAETELNLASELLKESGIRSFIDVPLIVRGDLIGSFTVLSDQPNAFEPVHLDIALEVANSLAVSIQQGRLLETEQRRRKELETLEQVSLSLRQADTREELFIILLTETRSLFNAGSGAILTPCEDKFEYTIVQGPQNIEAFFSHQRFAEDKLVEIITAEEPDFLPDLPFDKLGIGSAILLPIRFKQQTYGAMILHWIEHREFPAEERHMLNTIADMAGIAIERMHILENLEVQVTDRTLELTTLYELTALLAAKGDLTDTLQQTLERLLETINSFSGAIHLMDPEYNELDLIAHQGFDSETESSLQTILPDHILWEQLVERSEPLLLMNIDSKGLITAGIHNLEIKNYIGAPIQSGRETLGIISVFYTSDHDPSLDEISLLNLVADQVGIAVERTRLREQAEQAAIMTERQRLARELHDAVTQSLYSISFLAKASRNFAQSGEWEQVEQHLGSLQDTAQQALKEMRLLIYELLPTSFEQQGLESVLRHRLESVEQRAGVEVEFLATGSFNLPAEVQFDIYRIAQESLNNILKHAAATEVKVQLVGSEYGLEMTIEDNGTGFDPHQTSGGIGLDSMNDRADKLGGKFTINSDPGQGTRVKLTIDEVRS